MSCVSQADACLGLNERAGRSWNSTVQLFLGALVALVAGMGVVGALVMVLAQSKAQVLNTYNGSLALTNRFDVAFNWRLAPPPCWRTTYSMNTRLLSSSVRH